MASLTMTDVGCKLDQAGTEMLRCLELDVTLRTTLIQHGVIGEDLRDKLNVPLLSQRQRAYELIEDLRYGPVIRFLNFCKVMYEEGQTTILEALSIDLEEIQKQLGGKIICRAKQLDTTDNHFNAQRHFYREKLAKVPIYEYMMRSALCNIDHIFTRLELVDNQDDKDQHPSVLQRKIARPIQISEVFKDINKMLLQIIIEGAPGDGKTSLMKYCAVQWAKVKQGSASSSETAMETLLRSIDLLIYIDKASEASDLSSTIQNALKGSEAERDKAFSFWKKQPSKCFLFLDGIDEFTNRAVIKEMFLLASQSCVHMLVSCRTHHPYLDQQMHNFNRHVKVRGFDRQSATDFIERFMASCGAPVHMGTRLAQLSTSRNFLEVLYGNPMNCAFVCLLYASGEMTDEELTSLTMASLFRKQQLWLLKRECIRRARSQEEAHRLEQEAKPSIEGIHKLALYSLLQDKQNNYNSNELEQFGIDLTSTAMVLLLKDITNNPSSPFSWPHQIVREYHASCAVANNREIAYMVAAKPELNQISKFLLSLLLDRDEKLAKELLIAILLMQSSDPPCVKQSSKNKTRAHGCLKIPALRKSIFHLKLDDFLRASAKASTTISEEPIQVAEFQGCVQNTDWGFRNYNILKQIIDIMNQVSFTENHHRLLHSVIHPVLPSVFSGSDFDYNRKCTWDTTTIPKWAHAFVNSKIFYELHPTTGRVPLMCLQYNKLRGFVYVLAKAIKIPLTSVDVIISCPDQLIQLSQTTNILSEFAEKVGRIDDIRIMLSYKSLLWDYSAGQEHAGFSDRWKKAIRIIAETLQPQLSMLTLPSHRILLTAADVRELTDLGIKLGFS